ncbi:MAG: hypothetical protein K5795_07530 [Lachnospiraceae bacterium]|nr:hypothetical protein [Lachnospiraceae bacterium]
MGGIAYLLLCFLTGFCIVESVFKDTKIFTAETFSKKQINLSSWFFRLPAYFVSGVMSVTWTVYIFAYIFRNSGNPMGYANAVSIAFVSLYCVMSFIFVIRKKKGMFKGEWDKIETAEIVMTGLVVMISMYLMFRSLGKVDGSLKIGLSVFSDFSTHLSMIRSFSHFGNVPTHYTFFGGSDVKYHFMFQFLCGNLEFLGLRLDLALNIPSILSMVFSYFMLYVLSVKFCRKKVIGIVTLVLYTFRSSAALFEYILSIPEGEVISTLTNRDIAEFIGTTNHEDWGLWNLNVYANQRHFSFSLTIMLFIIILMLPAFYDGCARVKEYFTERVFHFKDYFTVCFADKEGWLVKDYKTCIFAGVILGMSGFFNGAVLIGTVVVLFFMAAASDRRLEFVILAGIAGVLALIQSKCFITSSLFSTQYFFGFLSEPRTLVAVIDYIRKLIGILPIVLIIQFLRIKSMHRYLMIAFSMPLILSFFVSLTPDIAVNHKYVMISIMLLDIYAAAFLVWLYEKRDVCFRIVAIIVTVCLTFTGLFEFVIFSRKNTNTRSIIYSYEDDIMNWIWENTDKDDIFLTANYFLTFSGFGNSIVLSGAQMYNAWEYFSWSAGYDVGERDELEIAIYSAENKEQLYAFVEKAGIDYIVIDRSNRDSDMYELNEFVIDSSYEKVFSVGAGEDALSIYDTHKKI